jgi:hypothetical protein
MIKQPGKVTSQVMTIWPATPQRTERNPRVAPTPIIYVLTVWVVLREMPMKDATMSETLAEVSFREAAMVDN